MLRHTDLCSGIGGFSLGFSWSGLSEPVLFCEIDPWCRKVLAKHWPDVPIAEDVKELANDPNGLVPDCDILSCGYPCQPFSQAGVRRGEKDDRHIWPEIFAIVQAKRPTWCVFENVYGHISLGLDQVLSDLEAKGYATRTFVVPACGVDAPHRRYRLWIVGHTTDNGRNRGATQTGRKGQTHQSDQPGLSVRGEPSRPSENVADTDESDSRERQNTTDTNNQGWTTSKTRRESIQSKDRETLSSNTGQSGSDVADTDRGRLRHTEWQDAEDAGQSPRGQEHGGWDFEPPVGRVANGIPRRVDRLKGLGNAIVPQIAMRIGQTIKAVNSCNTE